MLTDRLTVFHFHGNAGTSLDSLSLSYPISSGQERRLAKMDPVTRSKAQASGSRAGSVDAPSVLLRRAGQGG